MRFILVLYSFMWEFAFGIEHIKKHDESDIPTFFSVVNLKTGKGVYPLFGGLILNENNPPGDPLVPGGEYIDFFLNMRLVISWNGSLPTPTEFINRHPAYFKTPLVATGETNTWKPSRPATGILFVKKVVEGGYTRFRLVEVGKPSIFWTFDTQGRLLSIKDRTRVWYLTYDARGRLTFVLDPFRNKLVAFGYSSTDNRLMVIRSKKWSYYVRLEFVNALGSEPRLTGISDAVTVSYKDSSPLPSGIFYLPGGEGLNIGRYSDRSIAYLTPAIFGQPDGPTTHINYASKNSVDVIVPYAEQHYEFDLSPEKRLSLAKNNLGKTEYVYYTDPNDPRSKSYLPKQITVTVRPTTNNTETIHTTENEWSSDLGLLLSTRVGTQNITNEYNSDGQLISTINSSGINRFFSYDGATRLLRCVSSSAGCSGDALTITRDLNGYVIKVLENGVVLSQAQNDFYGRPTIYVNGAKSLTTYGVKVTYRGLGPTDSTIGPLNGYYGSKLQETFPNGVVINHTLTPPVYNTDPMKLTSTFSLGFTDLTSTTSFNNVFKLDKFGILSHISSTLGPRFDRNVTPAVDLSSVTQTQTTTIGDGHIDTLSTTRPGSAQRQERTVDGRRMCYYMEFVPGFPEMCGRLGEPACGNDTACFNGCVGTSGICESCISACAANGESCMHNTDCCSGNCQGGVCGKATDCKSVTANCDGANVCCTGLVCSSATGGTCLKPNCTSCILGIECLSGSCVSGICGGTSACGCNVACSTDLQCANFGDPDICDLCHSSLCVACIPAGGTTCSASRPCCTGLYCNNGTCSTSSCGSSGSACTSNSQCCSGLACIANTCQSTSNCGADGQTCCTTSPACTNSLSTCCGGICSNNLSWGGTGQPCCNGVCDPNHICQSGICQTNTTCGAHNQPCCASGFCNNGLICSGGTCQPYCGNIGQTCCNGTTCSTGRCVGGMCV